MFLNRIIKKIYSSMRETGSQISEPNIEDGIRVLAEKFPNNFVILNTASGPVLRRQAPMVAAEQVNVRAVLIKL
jgi:hypothetical protein